jgi:hypothetical protein
MPTAEIATVRAAEGNSGTVALSASVDPAEPGTAGMVFNIELSRPAEQTIVLIYGTVDGTARAGTDYEPQQGVITLAPGTRSTQVRVPLIERGSPRDGSRRSQGRADRRSAGHGRHPGQAVTQLAERGHAPVRAFLLGLRQFQRSRKHESGEAVSRAEAKEVGLSRPLPVRLAPLRRGYSSRLQ